MARGEFERGIVLGGSGNGEAIVANRVRGIRCGVCWNEQTAVWHRAHNDGNVLSIGERTVPRELALRMVEVWLETPFDGGRHLRRIQQDRRRVNRRPVAGPAGAGAVPPRMVLALPPACRARRRAPNPCPRAGSPASPARATRDRLPGATAPTRDGRAS